ncbi:MAG: shikimate kinase [Syntrophus sp. (in: bacteria)]|nr:shikimate kinase [Syntrophus sp. (in: bacteria)]
MTRDDRTIILIGYRGTGKTSVGRELARRLNRPFYDIDVLVEAREGRSIRDMVEREGWTFFREREKAALCSLRTMSCCVVATGGGAVLDPDNARLLKSMGWIVLLTAREGSLARRILQDPTSLEKRPSFSEEESAEQSMESMIEETKEILAQRMPIYRSLADLVIDTADVSPEQVADHILSRFSFGE